MIIRSSAGTTGSIEHQHCQVTGFKTSLVDGIDCGQLVYLKDHSIHNPSDTCGYSVKQTPFYCELQLHI